MRDFMVSISVARGVAVVRVHNPPVNTINAAVRRDLGQAIASLRSRDDVRAVVLGCAGSTFFSGADIGPRRLALSRPAGGI